MTPAPRVGRYPWKLDATVAMLVCVMAALLAIAIMGDRERGRDRALAATGSAADQVELAISGTIDQMDTSLQSVVSTWLDLSSKPAPAASWINSALAGQGDLLQGAGELRIADAKGIVRYGNPALAVEQSPRLNSDFFRLAREQHSAGLIIAGPEAQAPGAHSVLVLARRLSGPGGEFAGVVYASVRLDRFDRILDRPSLGRDGYIELRNGHAGLIRRRPTAGAAGVADPFLDEFRRLAASHPGGHFETLVQVNGEERLLAVRRLARYPLFVAVTRSPGSGPDGLRAEVVAVIALAGLLLIVSIAAAWRMHHQAASRARALSRLANVELQLKLTASALGDALWDWKIEGATPTCLPIFGLAPQDLAPDAQESVNARLHPDDRDAIEAAISKYLQSDEPWTLEGRIRADDGIYRVIRSHGKVVQRDPSGQAMRAMGTHTDVTQTRALAATLNAAIGEIRAIYRALDIGIALLKDQRIVRCNRRLEEMFGAGPGGLDGEQVSHRFADEATGKAIEQAMHAAAIRGEPYEDEHEFIGQAGRRFSIRFTGQIVARNDFSQGIVAIAVATPVDAATGRRKTSVTDGTAAPGANVPARAQEVRTLVNAILSTAHMALKSDTGTGQRGSLQEILASGQHLLSLFDDLPSTAQDGSDAYEPEHLAFDLHNLAARVSDTLTPQAMARDLTLAIDIPSDVPRALVGDERRLGCILEDLGSCALQFTNHGAVSIHGRVAGPPEAHLAIAFEVSSTDGFVREQFAALVNDTSSWNAPRMPSPAGIGPALARARRFVMLMGGTLELTGDPGRRCAILFSVHLDRDAGAPPASIPVPPGTLPVIEGLETQATLARSLCDVPAYLNLLRTFVDTHRSSANQIVSLLDANNWPAAEQTAHTLAASAGLIGADVLRGRARDLQMAIRQNEPRERIDDLLAPLSSALATLMGDLQRKLPAPDSKHGLTV